MTAETSISIRPFEERDWPRLCAIHDAARPDELARSVGPEAFLSLERTFESEGLFDGRVAVAEAEGRVAAFAAFGPDELTWLYVDPAFQRRGLGRALVRHVKARSASELRVEVLDGNWPALRLYRSEGFGIVEATTGRLAGNEAFAASGFVLRLRA